MKKDSFLERSRNIHGYKYDYIDLPPKINLTDKILLSFNGMTFSQVVNKHLMGRCPEKSTNARTLSEFISLSVSVWKNKYNYSLSEYINAITKIKIILYGVVYEQIPAAHLNKKSPEFRLIDAEILNRNKIVFKLIEKFIRDNNIDYIKNFKMNNINIFFDFFIPSMNTVIDFDISGYYDPINNIKSYEKLKINDKIKEEYCEDNFIDLIRIKYDSYDINQILWNNLKEKIKLKKQLDSNN